MRCSIVFNTNNFTVIFNQFFCECLLKIQLFTNINEKHFIGGFTKGWSEFILNEISDYEIGGYLEFLFSASIKQFYKNVDLLLIDMCIVNNMDNIFVSKYNSLLLSNSLSLMEKNHAALFNVNFALNHVFKFLVSGIFRSVY